MCALQMVANEYEELFPGDVDSVHVVCKTASLDPVVSEYDANLRNLEDLLDDYASQAARGKEIKRKEVRHPNIVHQEGSFSNAQQLEHLSVMPAFDTKEFRVAVKSLDRIDAHL